MLAPILAKHSLRHTLCREYGSLGEGAPIPSISGGLVTQSDPAPKWKTMAACVRVPQFQAKVDDL